MKLSLTLLHPNKKKKSLSWSFIPLSMEVESRVMKTVYLWCSPTLSSFSSRPSLLILGIMRIHTRVWHTFARPSDTCARALPRYPVEGSPPSHRSEMRQGKKEKRARGSTLVAIETKPGPSSAFLSTPLICRRRARKTNSIQDDRSCPKNILKFNFV